jgi:hypothetical protein
MVRGFPLARPKSGCTCRVRPWGSAFWRLCARIQKLLPSSLRLLWSRAAPQPPLHRRCQLQPWIQRSPPPAAGLHVQGVAIAAGEEVGAIGVRVRQYQRRMPQWNGQGSHGLVFEPGAAGAVTAGSLEADVGDQVHVGHGGEATHQPAGQHPLKVPGVGEGLGTIDTGCRGCRARRPLRPDRETTRQRPERVEMPASAQRRRDSNARPAASWPSPRGWCAG